MPAVLYLLAGPPCQMPRDGGHSTPDALEGREPGTYTACKLSAIPTAAIGYLAEYLLAISVVQIRASTDPRISGDIHHRSLSRCHLG